MYPIIGGAPRLRYRSLAQAIKHGALVTEVDEQGNVNEVLVCNASEEPVLLFEGELIKGARQDRAIDQSVLVPAGVELRVPATCVERGRWEHGKRAERFAPAPYTSDPELGRSRRAAANRRSSAHEAGPCLQTLTWRDVDARLSMHGVASPSMALTDVYDAKRVPIDELKSAIESVDGQVGAVVEVSGRPVALDLISRAEVFADLLPRLAEGYALQGLHAPARRPSREAAESFLREALTTPRRWIPTPGMGDAFALCGDRGDGCGLTVARELITLSAFPSPNKRS